MTILKWLLVALLLVSSSSALNLFARSADNMDNVEKYAHPSEEIIVTDEVSPSSASTPTPTLLPRPPRPHHNRITATKTLFVEVTKKVTRHPICMTVYGVLPPCLPHMQSDKPETCTHPSHHNKYKSEGRTDEDILTDDDEFWPDEMGEEGLYIEPTAAVRMPEMLSTAADYENEREARYLEIRLPSNKPAVLEQLESSKAEEEADAFEGSQLVENQERHLGSRRASTITKTLWVTKVQRVTDYRVTATLSPVNCVPTHTKIPICKSQNKPPHHKPIKPITSPPIHHKPTTQPPLAYKPETQSPPAYYKPQTPPPSPYNPYAQENENSNSYLPQYLNALKKESTPNSEYIPSTETIPEYSKPHKPHTTPTTTTTTTKQPITRPPHKPHHSEVPNTTHKPNHPSTTKRPTPKPQTPEYFPSTPDYYIENSSTSQYINPEHHSVDLEDY